MNVGHPIATHIVNTDIEQVSIISHLLLGDVDAVLDAALKKGFPEGLRSVRVGSLTNGQVSVVLGKGNVLIEACHSWFRLGRPGNRLVTA